MSTILLVEDDLLMSELYTSILDTEGYTAVTLSRGKDVVDKAKEVQPACIILDLMMPDMNGFEVLDALKKDPLTQTIPVVMFSNYIDPAAVEQAEQKGAAKYAVKSDYKPHAFLEMLKDVLSLSAKK